MLGEGKLPGASDAIQIIGRAVYTIGDAVPHMRFTKEVALHFFSVKGNGAN
jgi:hypothetical protein